MPTIESHGARLHYEIEGNGPAVVFAHGAGGNTLSWFQQVPHFRSRHTVVRFDHRGFGRSTCAPDDYQPKLFGDDVFAILDAEGLADAAIVGQSMGGWTALRAALERPERVRCMVLCGTPGGLHSPKVLEAAVGIARLLQEDSPKGNSGLAPDFPKRHPERAFLYDQISALNPELGPQELSRLFIPDGRIEPSELDGFAVPTLLLVGEFDALFPRDTLREVADLIPGARVVDFPGCGHSTYFEDPETFNRVVGDFIAAHGPARSRTPARAAPPRES